MADNEALARKLYEAFNEKNFDEAEQLMAPDGEINLVGTGVILRGPEGARQYNQMWAEGFPDGQITIDRIVASGDCVVVEYTGRGTHTGTLASPMGSIPATGRSVTLQLCDVTVFENGKIKSQNSYMDSNSLVTQLGLVAEQQATSKQ